MLFDSIAGRMSSDLAIDLGTANTLVYVRGKGLICSEPSVVAVSDDPGGRGERVLAVGHEAKEMLGRTPGGIRAIRPIKDGVIADFEITEIMLREFIRKAQRKRHRDEPEARIRFDWVKEEARGTVGDEEVVFPLDGLSLCPVRGEAPADGSLHLGAALAGNRRGPELLQRFKVAVPGEVHHGEAPVAQFSPGASMRRNHVPLSVPVPATSRRDENASSAPSGLHRGFPDSVAGLVRRTGSEVPSAATIQTSEWLRFSSSRTRERTNATRFPSGRAAAWRQ